MTAVSFKKAVKYDAKARVALIGPAGAGKTFTMLTLATLLADGGKIAAVDTEHGSMSKYADMFDFDVLELDSYSPENFMAALKAAQDAGYAVFCCDSLSHFWMGKDGALEFVDEKSARSKDKMSGWKDFRPHERQMVDAMIASPCHVICTMRTKTDYQDVEENGKKKRVKVGLAPVQRDGLEYEFDLVGYMDDENTFIVDKTRCTSYSGRALKKPSPKEFEPFRDWLKGTTRPVSPAQAQQRSAEVPRQSNIFHVEQDQVTCVPLDVQKRQKKSDKTDYLAVKLNGKIGGKDMAFVWSTSLFDAVTASKSKMAKFMYEVSGDYLTIIDVIQVEHQEYRGGLPKCSTPDCDNAATNNGLCQKCSQPKSLTEELENAVPPHSHKIAEQNFASDEITDDDLPF